ncbi:hypothetical protein N0824_03903 [Microcystis sp. 0824]|nr:hypothetical protein N0824_03903 [Microcystis sp. 0824]
MHLASFPDLPIKPQKKREETSASSPLAHYFMALRTASLLFAK